jgi:ABC-2 type transport system ATP-binding protein
MDAIESRHAELSVRAENLEAARALGPIHERQALGRTILLFDDADRERLAALGEVRSPGLADLFLALIGDRASTGAAA